MKPSFLCNKIEFRRVWHCFGNYKHKASIQTIKGLLDASGSNVLPINTHALTKSSTENDLLIGFEVSYPLVAAYIDTKKYIKMININHQTSAQKAFEKTQLALNLMGEPLVKLEVLNGDLKTSNDQEVIKAVKLLMGWDTSLNIMPLISSDPETAKEMMGLGCSLLRVMGSPIGSSEGILDPVAFEEICKLGFPIVLDGGVGHVKHFQTALSLGASGILINSMLFDSQLAPIEVMKQFMFGCEHLFEVPEADKQ